MYAHNDELQSFAEFDVLQCCSLAIIRLIKNSSAI